MAKSRDDLEKKLTELEKTAFTSAVKAPAKQSDEGRLTARERVATLLDPGSIRRRVHARGNAMYGLRHGGTKTAVRRRSDGVR